jgi:hypothetical protein
LTLLVTAWPATNIHLSRSRATGVVHPWNEFIVAFHRFIVMAGLVPAIHVFDQQGKCLIAPSTDVDGRHKGGHDVEKSRAFVTPLWDRRSPLAREVGA